ncbi:MAG TPA: DMT family transporter [Propionicimonas sp.]|nr:DMT family transporter [Propionicimonas sp.]HQA76753.1 DMT family transporter [Propionicimonas sp.]HQD96282.1 DMT family transporter [Propionicimonas sp.]
MASALWGFAFVAQRVGAAHVGPFSFTAVRFALGALVLLPIIWVRDRVRGVPRAKRTAATRAVVLPGIASGVLMTIAVNLQQVAMSDTPAGNAAFITGLYMVFVPVIAAFRGHRSNLATVLGVVASLVGLYLISVNDELTIGRGEWLLILSTVFWALQILVIEHFAGRLSALRFALVQFLTCAVVSSVVALLAESAPFGGLVEAAIPLLYGGLVSVGIAYTLQVVGQRHALATHASLIMATESVFGALGGALLLSEFMGLRGYAGAALMIIGIVVAQLGTPSARSADPEPLTSYT